MATATDPFAVLLNPNARRVSRSVHERISEIVDPDHLYISEDEAGAAALVERIVARGYDTVFTGGGDGTVTQFINSLPEADQSPRVGILKLGTGNAMAEIVSSGDPLVDLRTYAANPSADDYQLSLCEAEGVRFAFAGLGLDAWILNDYKAMTERLNGPIARRTLHSVAGYLVAGLGVSVPRMFTRWLRRRVTTVRITNVGGPAHAIQRDRFGGSLSTEYGPGDVLYEGPLNAAMFGTCPFYGYRLKALPFAGLDSQRFHLRLSNVPVGRIVTGLGRLWRGTLEHPGFLDYHVDAVRIELSEPMPYQLAGEAQGFRDDLIVRTSARPIDLVRFI